MSGVNFNNTTLLPATLTGTETLTNKTLATPAINSAVLTTSTVTTSLVPTSNDGAALGSTTNQFSDLFLAEGGVINFDNGDATLTQIGDVVTLAGADLKVTTSGNASTSVVTTDGTQTLSNKTLTLAKITTNIDPTSNDGAALGSTSLQFSDLFLAEGGIINWDNGDATLTQAGDVVTLAGADLKVTTPGNAATSVLTTDGTQTITGKTMAVTQLNGSAKTMAVNNTAGTANYTETPYFRSGQLTYAGTFTWAGTAPSGSLTQLYFWRQIGNEVRLTIGFIYTVAGVTNTGVTATLPSDCPAPIEFASFAAASTNGWPGYGWVNSASTGSVPATRVNLQVNAGDTGYVVSASFGSQSATCGQLTVVYETA